MKHILYALLLLVSAPVFADDRDFGLGIILGEPTGLSANYRLSTARSLDFALAYDLSGDDHIHFHTTYLFQHPGDIDLDKLNLGWYAGVGARILIHDHDRGPNRDDDDFRLGIRGALGVNLNLAKAPVEFFLELAPVMDIIESTDLDFDAGLGVRYYF